MKIIKKLANEEFKELKEEKKDLFDALGDMDKAYYCNVCDGLRPKGHVCKPWWERGQVMEGNK